MPAVSLGNGIYGRKVRWGSSTLNGGMCDFRHGLKRGSLEMPVKVLTAEVDVQINWSLT